jgi:hypothetical protein
MAAAHTIQRPARHHDMRAFSSQRTRDAIRVAAVATNAMIPYA